MIGMRRQVSSPLFDAASFYAEERHWPVAPGAYLVPDERMQQACSCGRPDCPTPGAHPCNPWWPAQASPDPATVEWYWTCHPQAPIVVPTGYAFDVIDVPESAGMSALERLDRLGLRLGPVLATGDGRMQFLVVPGAAKHVHNILTGLRLGVRLDLECRGEGDFIFAPPSRLGTGRYVRWVREPAEENRRLPDARALLTSIAYACYRQLAG
jgi:Bifunctional DNA primase/polymerase, N-terminal